MTYPGEAWHVIILPKAEKSLKRLPANERARIRDAIDLLEQGPRSGDTKPLQGRPEWRLRVGKWRALFTVNTNERRIIVLGIGPRGDVYKG